MDHVEQRRLTFTDALGRHTITRIARDSLGSHGGNPSLVIVDEAWTQPNSEMLTALSFSPVRLEPLMLMTSYAGYESDMVAGRPLYDWWLKLQPGAEPDPSFFGLWLTDEDGLAECPWWSEAWIGEQARLMASEPGAFHRLIKNQWGAGAQTMFTPEEVTGVFHPGVARLVWR